MLEISQISPEDLTKKLKAVMPTIPYKIGEVVVKFSMNRFSEQNWVNNGTQPWQSRKAKGRSNTGRAILVKSGRLRRSVRIVSTTSDSVKVGSDVPYAGAHNDGFKGLVTVRPHSRSRFKKTKETYTTRTGKERKRTVQSIAATYQIGEHKRRMNMPRRRFLGESHYQTKQIIRMIDAEIMRAIK
jgi:phage gpG-like protein